MKQHQLFDIISIELPDSWAVSEEELSSAGEGQPSAREAVGFDESRESGLLNVKCYQFETSAAEQQTQLLGSVYAETEKHSIAEGISWGRELLNGNEEGMELAITRWLICSTQQSEQFVLLIVNYSIEAELLDDDAIVAELSMLETTFKNAKWS